jgi:hypothetical protein
VSQFNKGVYSVIVAADETLLDEGQTPKVSLTLSSSFSDPDPGSGAFLTPGSGSGMNILDHISESILTNFWVKILKFFDADPDPGIFWTLDPGS